MPDVPTTDFVPPKIKNDLTARFASLIKNKTVYVAIDAANLYYSALKAKMYIDFERIMNWFRKHTKTVEIGFYTAYNADDLKQQEFLKQLESYGYKLIRKPIKIFNNKIKGNMDIEIAVDVIQKQAEFDIFVLMSGDGDFGYLINAIAKKTIVLSVGGFTSYELHHNADNYFFLNRIASLWRSPKNKPSKPKTDPSYLIFIDQLDYPEQAESAKLADDTHKNKNAAAQIGTHSGRRSKKNPQTPKIRLKVSKSKPLIVTE